MNASRSEGFAPPYFDTWLFASQPEPPVPAMMNLPRSEPSEGNLQVPVIGGAQVRRARAGADEVRRRGDVLATEGIGEALVEVRRHVARDPVVLEVDVERDHLVVRHRLVKGGERREAVVEELAARVVLRRRVDVIDPPLPGRRVRALALVYVDLDAPDVVVEHLIEDRLVALIRVVDRLQRHLVVRDR